MSLGVDAKLLLRAFVVLAVLSPATAFAQWMSSVGRNTQTGERTSFSVRFTGEDDSTLAIVCRSGTLSATYDTTLKMAWDLDELDAMNPRLLVASDGAAVMAYPAQSESITVGEDQEVQLLLDAAGARQLAEQLMNAYTGSHVSFSLNDTEMNGATYEGGAEAEPIQWALDECAPAKVKS